MEEIFKTPPAEGNKKTDREAAATILYNLIIENKQTKVTEVYDTFLEAFGKEKTHEMLKLLFYKLKKEKKEIPANLKLLFSKYEKLLQKSSEVSGETLSKRYEETVRTREITAEITKILSSDNTESTDETKIQSAINIMKKFLLEYDYDVFTARRIMDKVRDTIVYPKFRKEILEAFLVRLTEEREKLYMETHGNETIKKSDYNESYSVNIKAEKIIEKLDNDSKKEKQAINIMEQDLKSFAHNYGWYFKRIVLQEIKKWLKLYPSFAIELAIASSIAYLKYTNNNLYVEDEEHFLQTKKDSENKINILEKILNEIQDTSGKKTETSKILLERKESISKVKALTSKIAVEEFTVKSLAREIYKKVLARNYFFKRKTKKYLNELTVSHKIELLKKSIDLAIEDLKTDKLDLEIKPATEADSDSRKRIDLVKKIKFLQEILAKPPFA